MFWKKDNFIKMRKFNSGISKNGIKFINNKNELAFIELEYDIQGIPTISKTLIDDSAKNENISIVSSGYQTVILKQDGTVWACGKNNFCQCGQQNLDTDITYFTKVEKLKDIVQIACGTHFNVALDKHGQVWSWGTIHNTLISQDWSNSPHHMPYIVSNLSNIIWIECGQEFFYALDDKGILWGYGSNYYGSLGENIGIFVDYPVQVFTNFSDVISVYVCFKEAYAITKAKNVLRWTFDREHNDGQARLRCTNPEIIERLGRVVAISTSTSNALALTEQGKLWSWGNNFDAVLGYEMDFDIDEEKFFGPNLIENVPLNPISAVISNSSSILIYDNNEVWVWGASVSSSSPMKILPEIDISTRVVVPPRTAYNDHYIAFLDILGFKNLVYDQYGNFSSLLIKSKMELLSRLDESFKNFGTSIMLMSDSIVVSIKKKVPNALINFLYIVAEINGMLNGSVLRGAISFGSLYHKDNIVFGPAFINAYRLQESEAIYPRIIIKPCDIRRISEISKENQNIMNKYFLLDDDKEIFFDYLSFLRDIGNLCMGLGLNGAISGVTNAIMLNYFSSTTIVDKKISEKYEWLLKYIFIWQFKNIETYNLLDFFKFKILCVYNPYDIKDYQNCLPVFNRKIIIKHDNCVLLTNSDYFPTNIPEKQTYNAFVEKTKSIFADSFIVEKTLPAEIFKSISVQVYMDVYEKRPILEISQYVLWELKSLATIKECEYHWANIQDIGVDQRNVILALMAQ